MIVVIPDRMIVAPHKVVLERDGHVCQCRHCQAEGRTTIATEVDHIVSRANAQALGWSKARAEHPSNLQAINSDCHAVKTQEEQGKSVKPKRYIGLDGFPVPDGGGVKKCAQLRRVAPSGR